MRPIRYAPVYLGIFALLMTAVAAVIYTIAQPMQGIVYTLFWGAIYGGGLYACNRFGEANEIKFKEAANAAGVFALVLFLGGLIFSGIETGLILMLLTLQAGQNLLLSSRRNLNIACLISLIFLLYGAGKATEGNFIVFIVLYALAAIFTFMTDHIDARLTHAHGGDRQLLSQGIDLPVKGVGLAALILSLAFVIYLLVPQPPSPRVQAFPASSNWHYDSRQWEMEAKRQGNGSGSQGGQEQGDSGNVGKEVISPGRENMAQSSDYEGFKPQLDITGPRLMSRCEPDGIVFYLQADRPIYARGKVFDRFDGKNWEELTAGIEKRHSPEGSFALGDKPRRGDTLQVYRVQQEIPPYIFAATRPVLAAFPGNAIEVDAALTLRAPFRLQKGTIYSIVSRISEVDRHPCSAVLEGDEGGLTADGRYLSLYADISPRVQRVALEAAKEATDDFGRAKAVENYLRKNYAYTRDTMGVLWTGNPVEKFLFDLRAGHCELFASSMVIMLRTLNIPARLATGFYANRYNPVTGYYEVRRSDGHAWVEAYLEPHGWVTFEPTSSFELPRHQPRIFIAAGLVRYAKDSIADLVRKNRDSLWVKFLMQIWPTLAKIWAALLTAWMMIKLKCLAFWWWFLRGGWLVTSMGLLALAAGYYLWRRFEPAWRLMRLRRERGTEDQQRFLRLCYQEMEWHFAAKGTARLSHLTPLEYEQLLGRKFKPLAEQISVITELFQQSAYGPVPVDGEDADAALRALEEICGYQEKSKVR